jgi:flagellar hook-length control protein FliK
MDDIENLKLELKSQGIQVDSFTVKIRESFFSGMESDSEHQNLFNQNQSNDFNNFFKSKDPENQIYDNFSNQFFGNIDDNEYGSISYEMNMHDGIINLSV